MLFYFTPFDSNDGVLLIYPDVGSHINKMRGSIVEKLYYIHSSTSLEMSQVSRKRPSSVFLSDIIARQETVNEVCRAKTGY